MSSPHTALLALLMPALAAAAVPARPPNFLFILADDLGARDLGCYGAPDIRTPRLDRLAREGVRFTHAYSNGPECSPTRAALLTGRYQQRVGGLECAIGLGGVGRYDDAAWLSARHQLGLPAREVTLPRLLRRAGYATALSGKWHLGYDEEFAPGVHGFDHALYCVGGGMDYFLHLEDPPSRVPALRLNGAAVTRPGYYTDVTAADASAWLEALPRGAERPPFFLYLPFTAPHSPFQGPDEAELSPLPPESPRWQQGRAPPAVYAAMIERLDQAVGRVLDALDAAGESARTLVVFMSDNGGTASARPTGLRGIKGSTFEGGIRVPCLVRWPGVLPAGMSFAHPMLTFDLTASILRAAHVLSPRPLDGIDILAAVAAGKSPPPRALFWRGRRGERTWRAAREGDFKFVSETRGAEVTEYLFDLARDEAEANNLLAARPADATHLKRLLAEWERAVAPPADRSAPPP